MVTKFKGAAAIRSAYHLTSILLTIALSVILLLNVENMRPQGLLYLLGILAIPTMHNTNTAMRARCKLRFLLSYWKRRI